MAIVDGVEAPGGAGAGVEGVQDLGTVLERSRASGLHLKKIYLVFKKMNWGVFQVDFSFQNMILGGF